MSLNPPQIVKNLQENPQVCECHLILLYQRMDLYEQQRPVTLEEPQQRGSRIFSL